MHMLKCSVTITCGTLFVTPNKHLVDEFPLQQALPTEKQHLDSPPAQQTRTHRISVAVGVIGSRQPLSPNSARAAWRGRASPPGSRPVADINDRKVGGSTSLPLPGVKRHHLHQARTTALRVRTSFASSVNLRRRVARDRCSASATTMVGRYHAGFFRVIGVFRSEYATFLISTRKRPNRWVEVGSAQYRIAAVTSS
jgi:hypothetical protein